MNIFKNIKYIKNEKINFKSRIFLKLVFYFGISLLLFSVVTGSVFASMYVRNTINLNKKNLEIRALKVSETISRFWYADKPKIELKEHGDRKQHRKNMRMIEDIAMAKVWVIEKNSGSIIQEEDTPERNIPETYRILPPNAEKAVSTAFKGTVNTTEDFNEFLDKKALTTAAPIFKNGEVVGVVLLHSPIENLSTALNNGIYTLVISIFVALILASISAILLSLSFTKPLNKIKNTAILLSEGDYFRIRQMIIIILDNAIKFSYENTPIKINIGKTLSENRTKEIKMDISNKGSGISDEDISNIFERFHKSEGENNESGMGLGLAIAKQIALRHNIEISVSSIPNEETVFSFIFPVK